MKMTDYSKMSDFEINKAVAISVGFPCYYGDGSYTNNHGLRGAIVKGKNDNGLFMVGEFNPCNNPADAWTIIEQNKITIMFEDDQWTAFGGMSIHHSREADWDFCEYDKKPLRAAMIVFLMMQEKTNGG